MSGFQDLEPELRSVIELAEEQNRVAISPLQKLAGGWSGAAVYLVRVASVDSGLVQHVVLKLDRKHPHASSDEVSRHRTVLEKSPPAFVRDHIPAMAFDPIESGEMLAIFYLIAGQSLVSVRTLSSFSRQGQLELLFSATGRYLLEAWNGGMTFETLDHPTELFSRWLGFRLDPGQQIERFIHEVCGMPPDMGGFIIDGQVAPNPLKYARSRDGWGSVRSFDAATGFHHGDLNTNNVLARFARSGEDLEGYYLIDFSLFKEDMPLFYDQRYLEMSYLAHVIGHGRLQSVLDLIGKLGGHDGLDPDEVPIDMAGVQAVLRAARSAFNDWVLAKHPSLQDDLWGQYWLAGAAAGLSFCHKAGQPDTIRLGGLIFAAVNLKRYFELFGLSLPEEAGQLAYGGPAMSPAASAGPNGTAVAKPAGNVPMQLTSLVGRTSELDELAAMFKRPETRLLSLTGPGGTGKTRLAIEVARNLADQFGDGVFFVDLSPVTEPGLVTTTIAHAIGMREAGGRTSFETLKQGLAEKEMLLVLDNVEQVVAAGKDLSDLLASSPRLKILITSRIPLHVRGEREYPVLPLPVPPKSGVPLSEALDYDAVNLFCRQAKFVKPSFDLNLENQDAVAEICRQLDGLPLAIEIAAARVNMLPPRTLLKRLDHRLDLLVGKAQDLPDRQQTMRGTIDWSFDLLSPSSRAIFTRLGVFAGGFTMDAAEMVCRPMEAGEVFSGVETLLDNSMLRQVGSVGDEPRFEMLQTLREYALEKAEAEGVIDELRGAHLAYFTQMALANKDEGVYGAESGFWLKRYEEEHDNFRLALNWAFDNPDAGAQGAIAMMSQLTWFWYRHGYLPEGTEWTKRAVALTEPLGDSFERAFSLTGRAMLALWSGDLLVAEAMGRQALDMAERLRLDSVSSLARLSLGTTLVNQGRHTEAYPLLVDAVELFDQEHNVWFKGTVLVHLANVSLGMGNPTEALHWLDTALPLLKETGDIWNMAFGMNNYGEVARVQGDYEKAEEYYRRTEALYQQADAKGDQARLIHSFGYIALHKGRHEEARALFLESLDEFRKLGNHRGIAECLAGLADVAATQGKHAWAVPLLSAAESQLAVIEGMWWPADRVEIDRAREMMETSLSASFQGLWQEGRAMSMDEAIAYAAGSG